MTEETMMPECTVSVAESREVVSDDKHEAQSSSRKIARAVPITTQSTPIRAFQEDHEVIIQAVGVFPHRRRMVTGSGPTLRLWDLKDVNVLKKMEGHRSDVWAVAVSRDGRLIASGDEEGKLITWHGNTGESLTQGIDAHSNRICSLDFSPDGTMMASGSFDRTTKLWSTKTWQVKGKPIQCGDLVYCVRYSPSGELLAMATDIGIAIYDPSTRECVAKFQGHTASNFSLAWTPDGTRLLSAGDNRDPTIREWDASTWKQAGDPWVGHTEGVTAIAVNPAGTMIASASRDKHVRLWQLSDRRTIAIFNHSDSVNCVTFFTDGKHILSGGDDKKMSEWDAEVRRALLVAVAKVPGFTPILAHEDVVKMRDFLVNSRDYQPDNIVLMMHRNTISPKLYPSRQNILREIDLMVRRTAQHDHLFFYYSGYGVQVTHNTETDGKDELAIFAYTGKRIIGNVLKKRLVDPLPYGAKLFALWDCGHSHTMLDLEHYKCNELWRAPFKVLSGLGRKTKSSGERLRASFLRDSSDIQSLRNDNSQRRFESLTTDNMGLGPRAASPETYLRGCTLHCPVTLPEERVKAHVISLSACRDNEVAYDNIVAGETVTEFFIAYLERNPKASYHDLLSYIQHKVDGITLRRTQELSKNKVENENRLSLHQVDHSDAENDSTLNSQRPSYSSCYPLDMLQIVDL